MSRCAASSVGSSIGTRTERATRALARRLAQRARRGGRTHAARLGTTMDMLLPDDPELAGVSVGDGPLFPNLNATIGVAELLRERCAADGICEVGLTVIITPAVDDGAAVPTEITLAVDAVTAPEGQFAESASVELEIDGEAPVAARRPGT